MKSTFTLDSIGILLIILIVLVTLLSPFFHSMIKKIIKSIKGLTYERMATNEQKLEVITEIKTALFTLQKVKRGGTIIIDKKDETHEYINNEENIDSIVSASLLINIFKGIKSPLHDGAVIIKHNRIHSASAYITNLSKQVVPLNFGTRHRSALGLSEVTKAIIIVLSEEDANIRIFYQTKWEEVEEQDFINRLIELWVN